MDKQTGTNPGGAEWARDAQPLSLWSLPKTSKACNGTGVLDVDGVGVLVKHDDFIFQVKVPDFFPI